MAHRPTKGRECAGKTRYRTQHAARAHVASREARGAAAGDYTAYQCGQCHMWHVGHSKRRQR